MVMFWIGAALLAAGAAAAVLHRAAQAGGVDALTDPTLGVYRRALAEIDDLADRGLIAPREGRASRAEAGRRLLAAADRQAQPIVRSVRRSTLIAAAAAAPLLALAIYMGIGTPGAVDQPFSRRLAIWLNKPELSSAPELAAALHALAAQHPNDPEPLRRLAVLDAGLGDPNGATHALRQALAIAPRRPDLLGPLGEIMVLKAGGKVDGDAQAVFRRLLQIEPKAPVARYYLGLADINAGRKDAGLTGWRGLLADLPPGDPRAAMLTRDIASVEQTGLPAAQTPDLPPGAMSAAIRGMVEGLAQRLKAHPDDAAGWVRLVRAYGVLGEPDRQGAALATARKLYAGKPDILAQLDAAVGAMR